MARMNIYINDSLKARMDGIEKNWSAIASHAFEREVVRIEVRQTKEPNMQDVVSRLRESKTRQVNQIRNLGHTKGRLWAMEEAEYEDLRMLHSRRSQNPSYPENLTELLSHLQTSSHVRDMSSFLSAGRRNDEWRELYFGGEVEPSPHYLEGFVNGALEVWGEVQDQI